jgi:hypothetical protein
MAMNQKPQTPEPAARPKNGSDPLQCLHYLIEDPICGRQIGPNFPILHTK